MAELIRGKTGRVYGHLFGMLTVMKSLPLAYNKDLQEDKEGMFDTVETILNSLDVLAGMLSSLQVNKEKMQESTEKDFQMRPNWQIIWQKKVSPLEKRMKL